MNPVLRNCFFKTLESIFYPLTQTDYIILHLNGNFSKIIIILNDADDVLRQSNIKKTFSPVTSILISYSKTHQLKGNMTL